MTVPISINPKPNEKEKKALQDLVNRLNDCKDQMDPEAIQTIVYSVGKDNGYKENLREWFKAYSTRLSKIGCSEAFISFLYFFDKLPQNIFICCITGSN